MNRFVLSTIHEGLLVAGTAYSILPEAVTELAHSWDTLFNFLIAISAFFFIPIVGLIIYFVFKYRDTGQRRPLKIHGNNKIEFLWTFFPLVLSIFIFAYGWVVYKRLVTPPTQAYEIKVIGKQWLWQFVYENGKTTIGELVVPVNRRIKLVMTSDDVIHSFYIPAFRVKNDVVPGMYTSVWFQAEKTGEHIIYCSEYCGLSHSIMTATVKILPDKEYLEWYEAVDGAGDEDLSPVDLGRKLMTTKGCVACHSSEPGVKVLGPSLANIWGKQEQMSDGTTAKVDENYIRQSLIFPGTKKRTVAGYPNVMPSFKGILNEREVLAIIAYIQSLE